MWPLKQSCYKGKSKAVDRGCKYIKGGVLSHLIWHGHTMFECHAEGSRGDAGGKRFPGEQWRDTSEKSKVKVMTDRHSFGKK